MDEMNFTTSTHDMTTAELLSELRRRNVKVWAAGDRLRYSVGDGVVPAELQELLTERKAEILEFLTDAASARSTGPAILPSPAGERTPLSFAQQRLWFINELEPGLSVYNVPEAARIRGPLNAGALSSALSEIVRRHEVLRTVYPAERGQPVQKVLPPDIFRMRSDYVSGLPEVL